MKGVILYYFLRMKIRILILGYLVVLYAAPLILTSACLLLTAADLLLTFPYVLLPARHYEVNCTPIYSSKSINRQLLQQQQQRKLIIFHSQEHITNANMKHHDHITGCLAVSRTPTSHTLRFRLCACLAMLTQQNMMGYR